MTLRVDQPTDDPAVYVVSAGRAGSTYVAGLLSRLDESLHVGHQVAASRVLNIAGNILLRVRSEKAQARVATSLLNRLSALDSTADPLQSVLLTLHLLNAEERHGAHILHLVRDPRDFVTSFMNWKDRSLSGRVAHHIFPFWQPSPLWQDGIGLRGRFKMSKFEHFCWVWTLKNRLFESLEGRRDKYLRVRFEDITGSAGAEEVGRIARFLGIRSEDMTPTRLLATKQNASPAAGFPSWRAWDSELARVLHGRCGDEMSKYGYGLEPEWIDMKRSERLQNGV